MRLEEPILSQNLYATKTREGSYCKRANRQEAGHSLLIVGEELDKQV